MYKYLVMHLVIASGSSLRMAENYYFGLLLFHLPERMFIAPISHIFKLNSLRMVYTNGFNSTS